MNLQKAKEILLLNVKMAAKSMPDDCKDACLLGAEALERLEDWRLGKVLNSDLMLPGETED